MCFETDQRFIQAIYKLNQQFNILNSSEVWEKSPLAHIAPTYLSFYPLNFSIDPFRLIDETDQVEANILIITNNIENIAKWQIHNFSVILLESENQNYDNIQINYLPDQVWPIDFLQAFADNIYLSLTWPHEYVGGQLPLNYTPVILRKKFIPDYLKGENLPLEILITGRYFKAQDVRAYTHTTTQAILNFKDGNLTAQKNFANFFTNNITYLHRNIEQVNLITCVPPRPGKENRFNSILNHLHTNVVLPPINFNLLRSTRDYPSPKSYKDLERKLDCVHGVFTTNFKVMGHVVLIDDVLTSGVTAVECAKELLNAGAKKVTIIPFGITQNFDLLLQNDMHVLVGDNESVYRLRFNKKTLMAFWANNNNQTAQYWALKQQYIDQNNLYRNTNYNLVTQENDLLKEDIECIIFDLDDTLVNTKNLESFRKRRQWQLCKNEIPNNTFPILDLELIRKIQSSGVKIGIVTNSPESYAEAIISYHRIPCDKLVSYYDTIRKKPSSEPLMKCVRELEVNVERSINIGDNAKDILAGNRANMKNIAVKWGDYKESDFAKIECEYVINNPHELNRILNKIIAFKNSYSI